MFEPIGLLAGPFAGALAGKLLHQRSLQREHLSQATRSAFSTWFGIVLGTRAEAGAGVRHARPVRAAAWYL